MSFTDEHGLNFPPGHPFIVDSFGVFRGFLSATKDAMDPTRAWNVNFGGGIVQSYPIHPGIGEDHVAGLMTLIWCVRDGGPLSEY